MADRLRKARVDAGYTAQEIADVIGISRKSVTNYENADTRPLRAILNAWAEVTGTYVEWLEHGKVPPFQASEAPRVKSRRGGGRRKPSHVQTLWAGSVEADAPIAQLAELRTFNPKAATSDAQAMAVLERLVPVLWTVEAVAR